MTRRSIVIAILFGSLLTGGLRHPLQAQTGYRLTADKVQVNTAAHWQNWKFPKDVAAISAAGWIEPRFIPLSIDAVQNAERYTYEISAAQRAQYANAFEEGTRLRARGGIKQAGSQLAQAGRIIDGNPQTFWEPDPQDPLDTWWVEIDLGRLVSATHVVLHFAEDHPQQRADPFLQFRIHSATGLNPFGAQDQSGALDYTLIGGTTQPNRDQRVFEFELTPLGRHSDEWTGRTVQYLRIAVTASRTDRAELVSLEEYQALAAADRGAVDHVWAIGDEERLVTPDRYGQLPAEQQGGVHHYRHERPKLAMVEVWTVGENLALGLLERGGSFRDINPNSFPERLFDGNLRTDWFGLVYRTTGETAQWGLLTVDLGAQFWVDMVRLISRTPRGGENLLFGYLLRGSDGSRAPDGSLIWTELSSEERQQNRDVRLFADRFALRRLRFLEFRNLDIARRTRAHLGDRVQSLLSEMQVFGNGFPPALELESDIIDLQFSRNLTTIDWQADAPPGTRVEIRTRTGNELREVNYYYRSDGSQVATREAYDRLPSFFKGPIVTEILPGQGWSNWSQPYLGPGELVRSPSPRRYLMIQARLLSNDPQTAARLRSVEVNFVGAVAERVVGEITPKQGVEPGELTDFELFVRPQFGPAAPGIDRFRLVGPSETVMELQRLTLGSEEELQAGLGETFVGRADGQFANPAGEVLTIDTAVSGILEIQLPRLLTQGSAQLVRFSFRTQVFQSGSTFAVAVGNSRQPEIWQQVDPGEAVGDALSPGSGLTVMTPLDGPSIKIVEVQPSICTPNGDGINDEIIFEFAVLKIAASREVTVELFDLAGNRLRRLSETRPMANGLYRMAWDGRNERGELAPPGLYLAEVRIASDRDRRNAAQVLVGVAY